MLNLHRLLLTSPSSWHLRRVNLDVSHRANRQLSLRGPDSLEQRILNWQEIHALDGGLVLLVVRLLVETNMA